MVGLDFRFRGNDGWWGWISACAGNDGVFFRVLGYGSMNSRLRGNDGWWGWISAFAGMTEYLLGLWTARNQHACLS